MQFKQAWFELGIPRLEDRGASPLSINFGKKNLIKIYEIPKFE